MGFKRIYLLLICILGVSGCAHYQPNNHSESLTKSIDRPKPETVEDLFFSLLIKDYLYWKGTPYRFGGNSKKGLDCSALVQDIYKNSFKVHVPRTTIAQVKMGVFVKRSGLKVADLIFFKTGRNVRHVGIYMGDNEFLHVSESKGVIISSLDNVYWKPRYWQSRRIIN